MQACVQLPPGDACEPSKENDSCKVDAKVDRHSKHCTKNDCVSIPLTSAGSARRERFEGTDVIAVLQTWIHDAVEVAMVMQANWDQRRVCLKVVCAVGSDWSVLLREYLICP